MLRDWLVTFANDQKVQIAIFLVAVDLLLGIAASVKPPNTFKLSYVADLLKNDLLGKLLPYFGLYVLAIVAGGADIVIPGLDFGVLAGAAYGVLVLAMTGSILSSLKDLGIPGLDKLPDVVAGSEKNPEPTAPPATP